MDRFQSLLNEHFEGYVLMAWGDAVDSTYMTQRGYPRWIAHALGTLWGRLVKSALNKVAEEIPPCALTKKQHRAELNAELNEAFQKGYVYAMEIEDKK